MEILTCAAAASDTHHRIDSPNSRQRCIKVVGIGQGGARVARAIEAMGLRDVNVVVPQHNDAAVVVGALQSLAGADMLFVVACAGDDLGLAPLVKQAVRRTGILVTGVLIQQKSEPAATADLAVLRAASDLLVIASDENYVTDMLVELGA
jgi:cell division GTPase FtsZ